MSFHDVSVFKSGRTLKGPKDGDRGENHDIPSVQP
jgi:hypothetical protein